MSCQNIQKENVFRWREKLTMSNAAGSSSKIRIEKCLLNLGI